jgi:hypothetical protein
MDTGIATPKMLTRAYFEWFHDSTPYLRFDSLPNRLIRRFGGRTQKRGELARRLAGRLNQPISKACFAGIIRTEVLHY